MSNKNQPITPYSLPANAGFTLIELLVVTSIMVILSTVLTINLAGNRSARDLKIAANRLASEIRKIQSYTLSGRSLPTGESVQYYILKFDLSNPTQYTIQAVYDVSSQPKLVDVETIKLPPNIRISLGDGPVQPLTIRNRLKSPGLQFIYSGCVLVAFAAPLGKVTFNDGCSIPTAPLVDRTNLDDDYNKILSFQVNVACDASNGNPPNPSICSASTDSLMVIKLTTTINSIIATVRINAITGTVTFF